MQASGVVRKTIVFPNRPPLECQSLECGKPTKQTKESDPVAPVQISTDPCIPFTLITVLSLALLRPICELFACQIVLKSFTDSYCNSEIH